MLCGARIGCRFRAARFHQNRNKFEKWCAFRRAHPWVLAGASLYFGIDGARTVDIARGAATLLMGIAP